MTDEPQMDDTIEDPALDTDEGHDEPFDDEMDFEGEGLDTEEILMAASLDRMHRQAYWHGTSKQLFTFLFANCLFFAGCLVAWTRAAPGENGDPSTYITGLHTIRGAFIFALSIYGFWTAAFNLYSGQMKVWPYVLNSVLALWVGVAGFAHGIGGDAWKQAGTYLDSLESKMVLDDILVRLSVIAPGCWLLTLGGVLVLWLILSGIMKGAQQSKGGEPAEAAGSGRRRR